MTQLVCHWEIDDDKAMVKFNVEREFNVSSLILQTQELNVLPMQFSTVDGTLTFVNQSFIRATLTRVVQFGYPDMLHLPGAHTRAHKMSHQGLEKN